MILAVLISGVATAASAQTTTATATARPDSPASGSPATAPTTAQQPTPSPATRSNIEPRLRRWVELQTFTLHIRNRYLVSNRTGGKHDPQYKEAFRGRINLDPRKRYTVNAGFFSGTQFIGTFDNVGIGEQDGDYHSHYLKQLFLSATPVPGLEFQYGGIYVVRGESTEITTYDDDGYIVGQRVSVRRPKQLYFDDITVTHGLHGPTQLPNLFDRWYGLKTPNYYQILASKRFSPMVAASADYMTVGSEESAHAAVALQFTPTSPLTTVRYEQYYRFKPFPATGYAITVEPPRLPRVRFSGGYTSIDEHYDGNTSRAKLNSERMQRGRRFFVTANVAIAGPLSAVIFFTRALSAPYELTNRTRNDIMFQYDVLSVLRSTGKL